MFKLKFTQIKEKMFILLSDTGRFYKQNGFFMQIASCNFLLVPKISSSQNKKAFQSNANCPLAIRMGYKVNKFDHVGDSCVSADLILILIELLIFEGKILMMYTLYFIWSDIFIILDLK